ncbi:protein of unknown function [Pseudomonas mediterranea]
MIEKPACPYSPEHPRTIFVRFYTNAETGVLLKGLESSLWFALYAGSVAKLPILGPLCKGPRYSDK